MHSECATGDILASLRCDCRDQLETALRIIVEAGEGLLIYMRGHEGRGIGLGNKIRAYALQDQGLDTVEANVQLGFPADGRSYAAAAAIMRHFGLHEVRLLTNNKDKVDALAAHGVKVLDRVPLWLTANPHNQGYLGTKREKMGHMDQE